MSDRYDCDVCGRNVDEASNHEEQCDNNPWDRVQELELALEQMRQRRDTWRARAEESYGDIVRRAEIAEQRAESYRLRLEDLDTRIARLCSLLGAVFPSQAHDIGFLETRVRSLFARWLPSDAS